MRTIRLITILLATLAVVAVIAALALGGKWQIQATQPINTPATDIFPVINTLTKWPEWTVWNSKNHPDVRMTYEGPEQGTGAIQIWHEGDTTGLLEIITSDPYHAIEYRFNMGRGLFVMNGRISLVETAQNGPTTVNWELWGDNGSNLMARLLTLAFKPMLKRDIQQSLLNLQQRFESPPASL